MAHAINKFALTAGLAIGLSGAAQAQSVLERVIGQIETATNFAQINGTFANIAENTATEVFVPGGSVSVVDTNFPAGTRLAQVVSTSNNDSFYITAEMIGATTIISSAIPSSPHTLTVTIDESGQIIEAEHSSGYSFNIVDSWNGVAFGTKDELPLSLIRDGAYVTLSGDFWYTTSDSSTALANAIPEYYISLDTTTTAPISLTISPDINASITNIISGVGEATAEAVAGSTTATEFVIPTVDFGDMSTTGLGAVNTGDITLGVNSVVDEATTSTTSATLAALEQIGGSTDTGAIVINVASNAGAINGSISNVFDQINGSIGNLSTTALGAVNTGTIISGVNAAVVGIVGSAGQ